MKRLLFVSLALLTIAAVRLTSGATIPAGTTLVVQTLDAITSQDAPGTRFSGQLATNVTVEKKVVLRAGIRVSGKVVTSRRIVTTSQRLTVDVTDATVNGHPVQIRTTGAVQLDNQNLKTRNDRYVGRAAYTVPAGRYIQFQLAQPIQY